jgi:chromosome segregation ATPase
VRTVEAQSLQGALDKCRIDNQTLNASVKLLRDELCACADVNKKLGLDLARVTTELNSVNTELATTKVKLSGTENKLAKSEADLNAKINLLTDTTAQLQNTKTELNDCNNKFAVTDKLLTETMTKLNKANDDLAKCNTAHDGLVKEQIRDRDRIANLEGDLKEKTQVGLGATREMAAAKKDAPHAIFNSIPLQAEGGAAPGGVAGPAGPAGGAAGGGAGGGGAAGAPGGGGGDGGFGSILGAAAGIAAFL